MAFTAPFQTESLFSVDPGQTGFRAVTTYTLQQGYALFDLPRFEGFYRFHNDIEVDIAIPVELSIGSSTYYNYGSTTVVLNYRIHDSSNESWIPSIGVGPQLSFPSALGDHHIGTSYMHGYLPLIAEKDFGPWNAVGNLAVGINPGSGEKSYGFAGASLTREITQPLRLGAELYYQSSPQTGLKDVVAFNVGGKLKLGNNQQLYFAVGRGLVNGANADRFHTYFAYQINF